jgi:chromosomal replication initiator protein
MKTSLQKTWETILESLKLSVSVAAFNAYLRQTELLEVKEEGESLSCKIACISPYSKNTLTSKYTQQIKDELARVLGKDCNLSFAVQSKSESLVSAVETLPLFKEENVDNQIWKKARLRADYTFENYAVAGSNQMAFAAATAVAKRPGDTYNPLFIYGGVGVGKTHLMQSIGHFAITKGETSVLFCTGEEFTNDLVDAIRNKGTDKVRYKYRKVRILLIDDIQFIAGKPTVQEEFFHTFNSILRDGGQIVMTSDRPPSEISKLEERLRSRFSAGMIVDIGPADFELRSAILLIKAKQRNILLPINIAQFIATQVEGLRELEGVLTRLHSQGEITLELAQKELKMAQNTQTKFLIPSEIMKTVGNYYGISIPLIKGDKRTKSIVTSRQILMYILRCDLKLSFEEIGQLVGGRDHSTVMHAHDKIDLLLKSDNKTNQDIYQIRKLLSITSG